MTQSIAIQTFAGARHSRSDAADIQALHEIAVRQGASCGDDKMINDASAIDCYIVENFVTTKPGDPYLWMPFGVIKKGNATRNVTPELAAKFKLPHFKPPIKLGSHDEITPAGGHIAAFEIRADGIWVTPELVTSGEKALADGAYRYHSPEVIWEDGYIQNPVSGELVRGPFIMGDALLHTPHLGELTALYSIEKELNTMADTVSIPAGLWDKFVAKLFPDATPSTPAPIPPAPALEAQESPEVMTLKAQASKADEYKAQLETLQADIAHKEKLTALTGELANVELFNATISGAAPVAADHLAAMPEPTRAWVVQTFKALSAQINESNLVAKVGKPTIETGGDPIKQFDLAARARMEADKITYNEAVKRVAVSQPELYNAYLATR